MLLKRHPSLSSGRQARSGGWTLAEMFIAVAAGTVILLAFVSAFVTLSNTMVAIQNYNDLDQYSRQTLDQMSRDLRDTATITSFGNTSLTASNGITGDVITYTWDGVNAFTRTVNGTSTILLTNCDALLFSGYTRVPTNNPPFGFITNVGPSSVKLITVSWRCSRTILGLKLNTESVQTARICIRN